MKNKTILFFSRGKGRGHVLRDLRISDSLRTCSSHIGIEIASYGTGASALKIAGVAHHDLEMPDENDFLETLVKAASLIRQQKPDLIVAHEEFAALVAADLSEIPSILITDWFIDPNHLWMKCLEYASKIIFLDPPGSFTEPPAAHGKTFYTGPIVRPLRYSRSDRNIIRHEEGIPEDAFVVTCLPGTTREEDSPTFNLIFDAFKLLESPSKRFFWIDGTNYGLVSRSTRSHPEFCVIDYHPTPERYMAASDLVICKGTRNTLRECAIMRIPTITLSHGMNWIDDAFALRFPSNTFRKVRNLKPSDLATDMHLILDAQPSFGSSAVDSLDEVVKLIISGLGDAQGELAPKG